eukprot:2780025-Rhodomonas_salina.2
MSLPALSTGFDRAGSKLRRRQRESLVPPYPPSVLGTAGTTIPNVSTAKCVLYLTVSTGEGKPSTLTVLGSTYHTQWLVPSKA